MNKSLNFRKVFLLTIAIGFCISGKVFASDNVLQAIQVDGVGDSYNIILKSDDVAELKKTIQAPNKMIINLKGIRASKTINTIYNNTSSVDNVVVEPTGDESVRIFIQGQNVGNADVHFDTLKTPLGILGNAERKNKTDEIVLSEPMTSYTPVYNDALDDKGNSGFSVTNVMASQAVGSLKKILKNEKISWMITFGLFAIVLLGGMKTIKGKDSDIRIGLSQSLKEREIDLYRETLAGNSADMGVASSPLTTIPPQQFVGNYGLKAYQNGTKSPYVSSEIQRPRPIAAPSVNSEAIAKNLSTRSAIQNSVQNTIQQASLKTAPKVTTGSTKPRVANIDSMKFLESMTKIYEKNGRTDLAQGLKSNMKKAKMNLA